DRCRTESGHDGVSIPALGFAIRSIGIENENHCRIGNCANARRRSCPEQLFAYDIARSKSRVSLIQGVETQISKGIGRVAQRKAIPESAQKHTRFQNRVRSLERCTLAACAPAPR